jgi:hypothetical protein
VKRTAELSRRILMGRMSSSRSFNPLPVEP